jgi:6-phosphogluconolactonase
VKHFGFLFVLLALTVPASGRSLPFYVGTSTSDSSSKGIYEGTLNTETGELSLAGPLALAENATFLALSPDGRHLYAAEELPGGGCVQAFSQEVNGRLDALNKQAVKGSGTCFVSVDATGHDVFLANYGSGSIACVQVKPDGSLVDATAFAQFTGSGPNISRQQTPHAHSIYASPDNAFVYACDLGTDRIYIFKLDAARGTLVAGDPAFATVPPGSGPRHIAFSLKGDFVYVANEMGNSVTVFSRNAVTGALNSLQTISTLVSGTPDPKVTTGEIVLHPSGKWLYVSNRTIDTISVFSIGTDGLLKLIQSTSSVVKFPRNFALDPTGQWLLAAGQKDNRIAVLKIDTASGKLTATPHEAEVGSPMCILFEGKLRWLEGFVR